MSSKFGFSSKLRQTQVDVGAAITKERERLEGVKMELESLETIHISSRRVLKGVQPRGLDPGREMRLSKSHQK
jgi:hypothetical protein